MKLRLFLISGLLFLSNMAICQVQDTVAIPIDSFSLEPELNNDSLIIDSLPALKTKKERFLYRIFVKNYPNPDMALYLSLAIPGAGQIYNKRWWKLPFVYGAYAGLIASVDFNTKRYKSFRDAYIAELKRQKHPYSDTRYSADDLKRIRDIYDKNRQLSYIGIVAVHLLQATEAFVDSHLRTFDISDDLSMKIHPAFQGKPFSSPAVGVGISLSLK
jgi:hypothetical protein